MSPPTNCAIHQRQITDCFRSNYHLSFFDAVRDDRAVVEDLEHAVFGAVTFEGRRSWSRFSDDPPQKNRPAKSMEIPSELLNRKRDDSQHHRRINKPHSSLSYQRESFEAPGTQTQV